MSTPRSTKRLQDQDFTYWFLHRALGWSVVLQLVWTFDKPLAASVLQSMNASLAAGPLNRRVIVGAVPLARPRWSRSVVVPALVLDEEIVHAGSEESWAATELHGVAFDPELGSTWRLRSAATSSGGSVVSLTALHLVADGKALTSAAMGAIAGGGFDPLTQIAEPGAVGVAVRDAADVIAQLVNATHGVGRALAATVRAAWRDGKTVAPPTMPVRPSRAQRSPSASGHWAIVTVDSATWRDVAKAHGGTANSLFVAVVSGALRKSGYAARGEPLKVGIPMSLRADDDDDRSNATAGVSVVLTDDPVAGGDLGQIRRKCKEAFAALSAGNRPAMIHLQPLLQLLPLAVVTRAVTSSEAGMPDVVVSNLGEFPPELLELGGVTATSVAFRGTAVGVDPAEPHRFGEGLQSWLLESGGTSTFSVLAFDELHVDSAETLRELLADELIAWGVPHRFW